MEHPQIIQGGMGVGVSGWRLARAVASAGQLGVVSGTALDLQLARRLQLGDPGGHLRRSIARFPDREIAERVLERYFVPGGIDPTAQFAKPPRPTVEPARELVELMVLGNFVEVDLAREAGAGDYDAADVLDLLLSAAQPSAAPLEARRLESRLAACRARGDGPRGE